MDLLVHPTKAGYSLLILTFHKNSLSNSLISSLEHKYGILILKMEKFVRKCQDKNNGFLTKKFKKQYKQYLVCLHILILAVQLTQKQLLSLKKVNFNRKQNNTQINMRFQSNDLMQKYSNTPSTILMIFLPENSTIIIIQNQYQKQIAMKNKLTMRQKQNIKDTSVRLSLRCPSSARKKISEQRMSIPVQRDTMPRYSFNSFISQQPRNSQMSSRPVHKQAIIQSLIDKLDNQQQLKTIIQSKYLINDMHSTSILTVSKDLSNNCPKQHLDLKQKLRNCQRTLQEFRTLARNLEDRNQSNLKENCKKDLRSSHPS